MRKTGAIRFTSYDAVINWITEHDVLNVRLYEDGQSVIITYEYEAKQEKRKLPKTTGIIREVPKKKK